MPSKIFHKKDNLRFMEPSKLWRMYLQSLLYTIILVTLRILFVLSINMIYEYHMTEVVQHGKHLINNNL